jgi:hypothetical protein
MSAVRSRVAAAAVLALALSGGYLAQGTFASTTGATAANKVGAAGSTTSVSGPNVKVALLTEKIKINNPTDLIISATAECSIITAVKTTGSQTANAAAAIKMWVEIDGTPVPVSSDDRQGGQVTFCDRTHQQETHFNDTNDQSDTIRTYLDTKNANGFNWLALNVGTNPLASADNVHTIVLYGMLTQQSAANAACSPATNDTCSKAVVGNRTLVLEPVKAANGEVVAMG